MNETLDAFQQQQARAVANLEKLLVFLQDGERSGVDCPPQLKSKLERALARAPAQKLKVALVGGFSEGKTAIAAAWLGRLDPSTMHITHEESSNFVQVLNAGPIELVDTPGLFGFKERLNPQSQEIERFRDVTKGFISEAHLVLYVMDPANPIKQSHQEELLWLFRSLDLLARTVFVLSRFDEVADVADESDYDRALAVKQASCKERLTQALSLTTNERERLCIVAVAANPFDLGVEHWQKLPDQWRLLSHIALLQQATTQVIERNGGPLAVVAQMRKSIVDEVLSKQLPLASQNADKIGQEIDQLEQMTAQVAAELTKAQEKIAGARRRLRTWVADYFSDLILRAKGVALEDFADFFEREVGSQGVVIRARVQNEFERELESVSLEINAMATEFAKSVGSYDSKMHKIGKQGLNYLLKGNIISDALLTKAGNVLIGVAKSVGLDLTRLLPFKASGAAGLAKGLNGVLAAAGIALELWQSWQQSKQESALKSAVGQLALALENQRSDLLETLNDEGFAQRFFASYATLKSLAQTVAQNVTACRQRQTQFSAWREQALVIEKEAQEAAQNVMQTSH